MIRNMTKKTIIFLDKDNNVIHKIDPCGETVIEGHTIGKGFKDGIPTKTIREIYRTVEMDPGIIYLVPMRVLRAFPGRNDFYTPMDEVKNSDGEIIGYRCIGRYI